MPFGNSLMGTSTTEEPPFAGETFSLRLRARVAYKSCDHIVTNLKPSSAAGCCILYIPYKNHSLRSSLAAYSEMGWKDQRDWRLDTITGTTVDPTYSIIHYAPLLLSVAVNNSVIRISANYLWCMIVLIRDILRGLRMLRCFRQNHFFIKRLKM